VRPDRLEQAELVVVEYSVEASKRRHAPLVGPRVAAAGEWKLKKAQSIHRVVEGSDQGRVVCVKYNTTERTNGVTSK